MAPLPTESNDGKLSQTPDGIDVAELVRVFPQITTDRIESFLAGEPASEGDNSGELFGQDVGTLSNTIELLETRLNAVDADKSWLRELLDRREQQLQEKDRQLALQAEKITALLTRTMGGHTTGKSQSGNRAPHGFIGSTQEAVSGHLLVATFTILDPDC